ncbi:MAG TPA: hypothetical protein VFB06_11405 [Streptosporangiaceae bacterium]|nr:hypothetical protein [Streptosporangiaceae bacterium]
MHDVVVPGDGGWFDLIPVRELTVGQQDEYLDLRDQLFEEARAKLPPPGPDPANPAMMAPAPEVRFSRQQLTRLHNLAASYAVTGTSYDGVLPWHDGSRAAAGLPAWNALRQALARDGGVFDTLLGEVPKEESPTTSGISGTSSSGDADAPLPGSAEETSATPTE